VAVSAVPRRSLIGAGLDALRSRSRSRGKPSRLAAAVTAAREHLATFSALASFDTAAWLHGATAGMTVLGVCLLVADFAVTGK